MPVVSSDVVLGDIGDDILTTGTPVFSFQSINLGTLFDVKSGTFVRGWTGRFEVEVPEGSTIYGVKLELVSTGTFAGTGVPLIGGVLATPSPWQEFGFQNTTTWPNRMALPWPSRFDGTTVSLNPSAWHDGAAGFSGSYVPNAALDTSFGFSEGFTPALKNPVTGLVDQVQSFFGAEVPGMRAYSASGTAMPIAFAVVPSTLFYNNYQSIATSKNPTVLRRPVLTIDFTLPEPVIVPAKGSISARVSGPTSVLSSISSRKSLSDSGVESPTSVESEVAGLRSISNSASSAPSVRTNET